MQERTMRDSKSTIRSSAVAVRAGLLALGLLHLGFAAACAKADAAQLVPDGPPLAMSAPPPRVITPTEASEAPPSPPNPEPPAVTAGGAPTTRPATGKPQPKPAATPAEAAVTVATPPPPPPAAPPLEVRAVPSAAAAAEDRKVREVMGRAWNDLMNRVNYQRLSEEGKKQYDQAKRFHEQADDALKEKNFILAMTLADKAAQLAAELAGRR
jgi:hypothetical protein